MFIDLANKRFVILGMQGTGKSILVRNILHETKNAIVYDVLREHYGINRYLVTHRQYSPEAIAELNNFVNRCVLGSGQIRMFVLEEANRFCRPKPNPLPESILDLNDFNRHAHIAFGIVARRPTQLHSDLMELAHYLFIYRLVGRLDVHYLDDIAEGLGEAVRTLPDYHFVQVNPDRSFVVHNPVSMPGKMQEPRFVGQIEPPV